VYCRAGQLCLSWKYSEMVIYRQKSIQRFDKERGENLVVVFVMSVLIRRYRVVLSERWKGKRV
jgi:hypothetical protein